MIKAPLRILIVAALAIAALIGLVVREGMARDSGTEVLLAMEAVDPRALLSGHYVIIGLTERLAPNEACPPTTISDHGWVALVSTGELHRVAGGAPTREEAAAFAPLVVRGSFTCSPPIPTDKDMTGQPGFLSLDIGIERFYVAQTEAERIDRLLRAQNVTEATRVFAIVSIGRDGRARLKGLRVDGERLELSWR